MLTGKLGHSCRSVGSGIKNTRNVWRILKHRVMWLISRARLSPAFIFSRMGSEATGLACVQPRALLPIISLETLQCSMEPSIYRISRHDLDCLYRSRFAWLVSKVQDTLRGTWILL